MSERRKIQINSTSQSRQLSITGRAIDLVPHKTIRIAVSGDVLINKLETRIIDTAEFQRLRSIKQLGSTYYVYPTAVHTRFDHSLGTLAMTHDMIRFIRENRHNADEERQIDPDQEQLARLVALLHDIGHIPFGHTLEDEYCIFPRHDKDPDRLIRFLGQDSTIGRIIVDELGVELFNRFSRLVHANKQNLAELEGDLFIYDLVNNTVCADLLDYLKRDSAFCNIDLDMNYRFLKYLYLMRDGNTRRVVVRLWKEGKPTPRHDILSELVRLLDNRYLLGERVYFHHTKLITSAMIAGAVQRAVQSKELKLSEMYEIGDDVLLYKLARSKNPSVTKLATSLLRRSLWYQVSQRTRSEIVADQNATRSVNVMDAVMTKWWLGAEDRLYEEDNVSTLLGLDPGDFLLHCPNHEMATKLAEMKVFWNGTLKPLEECTDEEITSKKLSIIKESHQSLWEIKGFLNPDRESREDDARAAFDYLFTYGDEKRLRREKAFYSRVVETIATGEGLLNDCSADTFRAKSKSAVDRLLSHTNAQRDPITVRQIVRESFGNQA